MAREKCAVCKAGIRENRRNYNLPKDINALVFFFGTTASNHPKEGKLCNLCYMNWRNTVTKQSGPSGVVGELPASSVATGSVELGNVELQDGPSTPKKRPPPDVANTDPSNESFSTIEPNRLRHHTPSGKVAKQTRCSEGLVNETCHVCMKKLLELYWTTPSMFLITPDVYATTRPSNCECPACASPLTNQTAPPVSVAYDATHMAVCAYVFWGMHNTYPSKDEVIDLYRGLNRAKNSQNVVAVFEQYGVDVSRPEEWGDLLMSRSDQHANELYSRLMALGVFVTLPDSKDAAEIQGGSDEALQSETGGRHKYVKVAHVYASTVYERNVIGLNDKRFCMFV